MQGFASSVSVQGKGYIEHVADGPFTAGHPLPPSHLNLDSLRLFSTLNLLVAIKCHSMLHLSYPSLHP